MNANAIIQELHACTVSAEGFKNNSSRVLSSLFQVSETSQSLCIKKLSETVVSKQCAAVSRFYSLYLLLKASESKKHSFAGRLALEEELLSFIYHTSQHEMNKKLPIDKRGSMFFSQRPSKAEARLGINFVNLCMEALIYWEKTCGVADDKNPCNVFLLYGDSLKKKMKITKLFYFTERNYDLSQDLSTWDFSRIFPEEPGVAKEATHSRQKAKENNDLRIDIQHKAVVVKSLSNSKKDNALQDADSCNSSVDSSENEQDQKPITNTIFKKMSPEKDMLKKSMGIIKEEKNTHDSPVDFLASLAKRSEMINFDEIESKEPMEIPQQQPVLHKNYSVGFNIRNEDKKKDYDLILDELDLDEPEMKKTVSVPAQMYMRKPNLGKDLGGLLENDNASGLAILKRQSSNKMACELLEIQNSIEKSRVSNTTPRNLQINRAGHSEGFQALYKETQAFDNNKRKNTEALPISRDSKTPKSLKLIPEERPLHSCGSKKKVVFTFGENKTDDKPGKNVETKLKQLFSEFSVKTEANKNNGGKVFDFNLVDEANLMNLAGSTTSQWCDVKLNLGTQNINTRPEFKRLASVPVYKNNADKLY